MMRMMLPQTTSQAPETGISHPTFDGVMLSCGHRKNKAWKFSSTIEGMDVCTITVTPNKKRKNV